MDTPITRQQLKGMVEEERTKDILGIMADRTRERVLEQARQGATSYTCFVNRPMVERKMDEIGWTNSNVKYHDILEVMKLLYPDCTVKFAETPVGKTITIDWS